MKNKKDLMNQLHQIDGNGYKSYKDIRNAYDFGPYVLSLDAIQGDPFASPSKARVIIDQKSAKFPEHLYDAPHKNIAVCDFITRLFAKNIHAIYKGVGGSGKSGLLMIDMPGQEILKRTSVVIDSQKIEARFEVGLPASGRRVLGRAALKIFFDALPQIVEKSLYFKNIDQPRLISQVQLSEDQHHLRKALKEKDYIAFIANGAILPRENGVSDRPLKNRAIPFKSPAHLEASFDLPNKGPITGMAIPRGVTLIVGGGYHGKSTLLQALERSVYNHVAGDGREFVITIDDAVKIRSEDGRRIEKVDISPYINNLPNHQDTKRFSTENASGSTSQAANILEAMEIGTELLLIDEDTCATNFMVRDGKMAQLVAGNKEPITPFISSVRHLYEDFGLSTIMVAGSSGDYFSVADHVIMMDAYEPHDVTDKAREIAKKSNGMIPGADHTFNVAPHRVLSRSSFPKSRDRLKVRTKGLHAILYNKNLIELRHLEQLVDTSQTNCLSVIFEYLSTHIVDDRLTLPEVVEQICTRIENDGLDALSSFTGHPGNLALPRKHEIIAALNRFRLLKVK